MVLAVTAAGTARALMGPHTRARQRDEALDAVARTSHEWVWEADTQLRITYTDERVRDLLGHEPDVLHGRALPTLLTDESAAQVGELLSASISHQQGWRDVELTWQHTDGHPVVLQGSAVPKRRPATLARVVEPPLAAHDDRAGRRPGDDAAPLSAGSCSRAA